LSRTAAQQGFLPPREQDWPPYFRGNHRAFATARTGGLRVVAGIVILRLAA
jgi:hypothetical protein